MAKRVAPDAALLMLHWQNSVCDPRGVWGKNLCRQIEKNNAIKNAQSVLSARNRGLLTIFVNIGWRPGFPELPENQYYPLLQGAKDENKGIVGTWEVDVIDALRPMASEPIVINFGSDSFESTRPHPARQRGRTSVRQRTMHRACGRNDHQARGQYGLQRDAYQRRDQRLHRQQLPRDARNPAALREADHVRRIHAGRTLWRHGAQREGAGRAEFFLGPGCFPSAVTV
jgi:hypothetical protein